MALTLDQIQPGIVAWLDPAVLYSHPAMTVAPANPYRRGPLLCVNVLAGQTQWVGLSSSAGATGARLLLRREWRDRGGPNWKNGVSYITDASRPLVGRDFAFVDAARDVDNWLHPVTRPRVTAEGLAAIRAEIQNWERFSASRATYETSNNRLTTA